MLIQILMPQNENFFFFLDGKQHASTGQQQEEQSKQILPGTILELV